LRAVRWANGVLEGQMPFLAPVAVEFWLLGIAIYERQRAMMLQHQLDLLAAALAAQGPHEAAGSNVVPFRRPKRDRAVVVELR
jgi:hypothetical protein